jgi:phosphopantetheine adenylyltransferase
MDIIRRAAHLVDRLVIGRHHQPSKSPMFTLDERLAMVRRETKACAPSSGSPATWMWCRSIRC